MTALRFDPLAQAKGCTPKDHVPIPTGSNGDTLQELYDHRDVICQDYVSPRPGSAPLSLFSAEERFSNDRTAVDTDEV